MIAEAKNEMTAGQMLKMARTTGRRKRELSTIARTLCIREDFLDALENDDFSKIPELVYILGFARNYAMELELDPKVIITKIKKQMGIIKENKIEEEEKSSERPQKKILDATGKFLRKNSKIILISIMSLVVVFGFGLILSSKQHKAEVTEEIQKSKYNLPIAGEYGLRNRDYATVVLQAREPAWVQIKNSTGTVVFEHTLVEGDVYYALNGMIATIGNAGALDVWVNGKNISKIGKDHERVSDIVLSPENLIK